MIARNFTKSILLVTIILISFNKAKSQWVTIPDPNFATYLNTWYPTCMNGNLMDTTCSGIVNEDFLNLNNLNLTNISGIRYFDNLQTLTCSINQLTSLPVLPGNLTWLDCSNNQLNSLPALPNLLIDLKCYGNNLTSLPPLPNSLSHLACYANNLTQLPMLPSSLTDLNCTSNQISNLPNLPNTLVSLWCGNNQLSNLPVLPNSLLYLHCSSNFLTTLPTLPNVIIMECQGNQLTTLPALPNSLTSLNCMVNALNSLPTLPNALTDLDCSFNMITCLPTLPQSLNNANTWFDLSENLYTCLPNYLTIMDPFYLTYPLCQTNNLQTNAYDCAESSGILGSVYGDLNNNCFYDLAEIAATNISVKLYDNSNNLLSQSYTYSNGYYNFVEPVGSYTVKIDTINAPFAVTCNYPGLDSTVVISSSQTLLSGVDFPIACKPGFDLGVQSVLSQGIVFPGITHSVNVIAGDMSQWLGLHCANGISGNLVLEINGPVTYAGITNGALAPLIVGNTYSYTVSDFGNLDIYTAFGLKLLVDTNSLAGDPICITATITPLLGDNNTSNNTLIFCYNVVNSLDPNVKETYPETVLPGFDDYFTYTIHFQNTGNAPAMNIHIEDTLDANLDLNTFELINYSHANSTWLNGNKLSFNFPNIQLPDSATNNQASSGFIQYRIRPLSNLPNGTTIHNKASIYFDYNAPVVTNTTENIFTTVATYNQTLQSKATSLKLYPNPSKDIITLLNVSNIALVRVMDVMGNKVLETTLNNTSAINISHLQSGLYFVFAQTNDGEQSIKFVKK